MPWGSVKPFVAALAIAFSAGSAGAATTIHFYDDPSDTGTLRGTLDCTESCEGLLTAAPTVGWSDSTGQTFNKLGSSASPSAETALVSTLLDQPVSFGGKTDGNGGSMSFDSAGALILLKLGKEPSYVLVRNLFGGSQTFSWTQASGAGAGLSHYDTLAAVPLPATGLLLLGGLGGLAALKRRRKAAA